MSSTIPNFLVCGPPKCASSSLHFYLHQHPEIFTSTIKQTRFFSVHYDKGGDWYVKNYFAGVTNEKMAGETTPTYSLLPFVAERIKKFNPEMKLVFCFRNPVERAFSGYMMRVNNGTEHLSFREALEENFKQRQTVRFETEADAALWAEDMKRGDRQDETGFRTYLEGSLYANNLKHYLRHFPKEQVKVILMDALQKDLQGTMKELFSFLGVDENFAVQNTEQKNSYKKPKLKILQPILGKNKKFSKMIAGIMPKFIRKKILNTMYVEGSKKKLTAEDRAFAYKYFEDDIAELEQLLQLDLSAWKLHQTAMAK